MSSFNISDDTARADIIKTARRRFQHYGYKKTNLSEIASDVNMSAGNLYRYFENKQDIARTCCTQLINEWMQEIRDLTQNPELTATDRLRTYAFAILSHSQSIVADPTGNNELVALMTTDCPELIHKKFTLQLNILGAILLHGKHTSEFNITSVHKTAKAIHTALLVLDLPDCVSLFSDSDWKIRITALLDCLLNDLTIK